MKSRTKPIRVLLAALALLVLISSCVSYSSVPMEYQDVDFSRERIQGLITNGENLRAIPLILRQEDQTWTEELYAQALAGLEAEWEASMADGDWRQALTYRRSFIALGEQDIIGETSEQDILLMAMSGYLANNQAGAAAAIFQAYDFDTDLNRDSFGALAQEFLDRRHYSVARVLSDAVPPREIPTRSELVDGTVTVWVNRGIRLVGNVGVPDRGIGSGFFIDGNGYVITNYHVIESEVDPSYQGYSRLYIKVDDESGERFPARVVGWDKNLDLALLKTEMSVPYVFEFSNQNIPPLGERISAIGSPGGLTRTVTTGTVSAYSRSIQPLVGSLQIDVPINPGNSGGPLLNDNGEVIGVVYAGISGFEGVNFAIPGPFVRKLIPLLYDGGQAEIPWIGVSGWDTAGRVEIVYVVPGTPASDAGLRPQDIVTAIDGREIPNIVAIQEYLLDRSPGTIVNIEWIRDGVPMSGFAALGVRPEVPLETAMSRDAREHLLTPLFGMTTERISGSGLYVNYRITGVYPGSIADEAGYTVGDTFSLRKWIHDEESGIVAIQMVIRGRKAGFLESAIQIGAYLNVSTVF